MTGLRKPLFVLAFLFTAFWAARETFAFGIQYGFFAPALAKTSLSAAPAPLVPMHSRPLLLDQWIAAGEMFARAA